MQNFVHSKNKVNYLFEAVHGKYIFKILILHFDNQNNEMYKRIVLNTEANVSEQGLNDAIENFDENGQMIGNGNRNVIKIVEIDGKSCNIKSFKIPNLVNQIVYRFFRKSKAQRSFEYARKLQAFGIGTPKPIAYYEAPSLCLFKKSYYVSEQLAYDLTFRELTRDLNYPNHDVILRAFTRFTFDLHEKGINFLDHSPGNTLIRLENNEYKFYLVDLNRMEFKPMDFETRIANFSRLTDHKSIIETMSDEYAKCSGYDYEKVVDLMWKSTKDFQKLQRQKRDLKKKLKPWKK